MIEIVLRKIGESGDVSEVILALLPTMGTIDTDHSTDVIASGTASGMGIQ